MLFKIIATIMMLGILILSPPLCVFIMVGLLPALVAYMVDIQPGKNTSATVFFFNLAGLTIPGMKFINGEISLTIIKALEISNLAIVYTFATMGGFIVWLVPKITVIIVDYKNERRAIRIREKIASLTDEWGAEVRK